MSDNPSPQEQWIAARYAILAGARRGLDLEKRVPELMRRRGWPHEDLDLVAVITAAVGLMKIGAPATLFRRPPTASSLRGLWPIDDGKLTARQLVERLELSELLQSPWTGNQ